MVSTLNFWTIFAACIMFFVCFLRFASNFHYIYALWGRVYMPMEWPCTPEEGIGSPEAGTVTRPTWMLENWLRSSRRTVCALSHWGITQPSIYGFRLWWCDHRGVKWYSEETFCHWKAGSVWEGDTFWVEHNEFKMLKQLEGVKRFPEIGCLPSIWNTLGLMYSTTK